MSNLDKTLRDINRRELNLRRYKVEDVLPDYIKETYPKFVSFLKQYYVFENESNSVTKLIDDLFVTRDLSQTDVDLLSFIEDELLLGDAYFQGFSDRREAAKYSNNLYRSKGSKYSIQQFFRMFYNEDPEITYTKVKIFNVGESLIGPNSDRYLVNDKLYQQYAILIKTAVPLAQWRDAYQLFAHPAGMYFGGEVQLIGVGNIDITTPDEVSSVPQQFLAAPASITAKAASQLTILFPHEHTGESGDLFRAGADELYLQDVDSVAPVGGMINLYNSFYEYVEANSPTLDEDNLMDSAAIGLSATMETIDQDAFDWMDSSDNIVNLDEFRIEESVPRTEIITQSATIIPFATNQMTVLQPYNSVIRTNPDKALLSVDSLEISELSTQYKSIWEFMSANSQTLDEDSSGFGGRLDLSNTVELVNAEVADWNDSSDDIIIAEELTYTRNVLQQFVGNFVGNYADNFTNDFTGNFIGDFIGDFAGEFAGNYTRNVTTDFTGDFTGDFVNIRTSTYTRNSIDNFTQNFTTEFTGDFAGDYIGNYGIEFSDTYSANYTRNVITDFTGDFAGNYSRNFVGEYTRDATTDFTGDFAGNFVGNYSGQYTRTSVVNYTGYFVGYFEGNYVGDFVGDYVGNFARWWITNFVGNRFQYNVGYYARSGSSSYRNEYFTGNYTGVYSADYTRTIITDFTGNFIGNYSRTRPSTYTRTIITDFTGDFIADFTGDYVGNYIDQFTRVSTRTTIDGFVGDFVGDFTGDFTGNYTRDFTGNYASNFTGQFTGDFIADFTGDYVSEFASNFTRDTTEVFTGDYVGNFTRDTTDTFTGDFISNT